MDKSQLVVGILPGLGEYDSTSSSDEDGDNSGSSEDEADAELNSKEALFNRNLLVAKSAASKLAK